MIRVALLCAVILLTACGKGGRQTDLDQRQLSSPPPTLAELRALLDAELAKLGKSTSHVASEAPAGYENKVFDLTAFAVELNAPAGITAPEGVILQWTEKLVGDYDLNGLVTISDITPLANPVFWGQGFVYLDPRGEGAKWPTEDAHSQPARFFDPIWRLARVDGEPNALITLGDISPIAKHLGEGLAGYRVYRKAIGDADYARVSGTLYVQITEDALEGKLDIPRQAGFPAGATSPDPELTVHYVFFDEEVIAPGDYEYVVAPYDEVSDSEGVRSFPIVVNYPADPAPVDPGLTGPYIEISSSNVSDNAPLDTHFEMSVFNEMFSYPIHLIAWDFDGDGLLDAATGHQREADFSYTTPGHYKATAYAILSDGRSVSTAPIDIDVKDNGNSLPVASLSANPTNGPAPLQVTLDASASTDVEGIAKYEFDPEGDGTFVTTPAPTYDHTYMEGEYDAVLRITDTGGKTATVTVHVSVGPIDNEPPTLSITNEAAPTDYAPELVTFTFTVDDPEDQPLRLEIDFDDDTVIDQVLFVNDGVHHASNLYDDFGGHTLRARVYDNWEASSESTSDFTLLENNPPVASLTADVTDGPAPLTVSFDASASSDPDGHPLTFYWDFDGDFNFSGPFTAQETFTYYEYGLRGVRVRVVDDNGAFSEAFVEVNTTSGWDVLRINDAATNMFNTPEISAALINGNPAIAYVRNGTLFFARSATPEGDSWTSAYLLDAPGFGAIEPSLAEVNGVPAIAYLSADGDCRYIYAENANGTSWNPSQVIDFVSGNGAACDLEVINGNPAIAWVDSLSHLNYIRALTPAGDMWPAGPTDLGQNGGYVFAQEIELETAGGLPAIASATGDEVHYRRGLDADGTLWAPPVTVVADSAVHSSAGMTVVPGLPEQPVIAYWTGDGLYSTTAADATGLSWSAPVMVRAMQYLDIFKAPEVELAQVGALLGTMSLFTEYFPSLDATATQWQPKNGIFDQSSAQVYSYAILDLSGQPFVALESSAGLYVSRLR